MSTPTHLCNFPTYFVIFQAFQGLNTRSYQYIVRVMLHTSLQFVEFIIPKDYAYGHNID
jgi:hypothetical protein